MARDKLNEMIFYIKKSNYQNKDELISYIKKDKIIIYNDNFCAVIRYIVDNNITGYIDELLDYCKQIYDNFVINSNNNEQINLALDMIYKYLDLNIDVLDDNYKELFLILSNNDNILYIIERLDKLYNQIIDTISMNYLFSNEEELTIKDVINCIIKMRTYYIDENAYFASIIDLINQLEEDLNFDILNQKIEEAKKLSGIYEVDEYTLEKMSNENKELKKQLDISNDKLKEVNKEIETSKEELKNILEEYKDLKKLINNLKNNQTISNNDDVLTESKMIEKDNSSNDKISLEALPMYKSIENINMLIEVFGTEKVINHEKEFVDAVTKIHDFFSFSSHVLSRKDAYIKYKNIIDINPEFKLYESIVLYGYYDIYTFEEISMMDEKKQSILKKLRYKPVYIIDDEFKRYVDCMYYSEKDNCIDNEIFDILYDEKINLSLEEYLNFDKEFQSSIIEEHKARILTGGRAVNKLLKEKRKEQMKLQKEETKLLEKVENLPKEKNNLNTYNNDYMKKLIEVFGIKKIDSINIQYINAFNLISDVPENLQLAYLNGYKQLLSLNPDFILKFPIILHHKIFDMYDPNLIAFRNIKFQDFIHDITKDIDIDNTTLSFEIIERLYYSEKDNYISGKIFNMNYSVDGDIEDYINLSYGDQERLRTYYEASTEENFSKFYKDMIEDRKRIINDSFNGSVEDIHSILEFLSSYNFSKEDIKIISKLKNNFDNVYQSAGLNNKTLDIFISSIKKIYDYCEDDIDLLSYYIKTYIDIIIFGKIMSINLFKIEHSSAISSTISMKSISKTRNPLYQLIFSIFVPNISEEKKSDINQRNLINITNELFDSLVIHNKGNIIRKNLPNLLDHFNMNIEQYTDLSIESQNKLYNRYYKESKKNNNKTISIKNKVKRKLL